jgi:hypothetical protein
MESTARPPPKCNHFDLCVDLTGKLPIEADRSLNVGFQVKGVFMIRKLKAGQYRLYSRKKDDSTGKRRNLGTFSSLEQAKQHEREVQYFKKH